MKNATSNSPPTPNATSALTPIDPNTTTARISAGSSGVAQARSTYGQRQSLLAMSFAGHHHLARSPIEVFEVQGGHLLGAKAPAHQQRQDRVVAATNARPTIAAG